MPDRYDLIIIGAGLVGASLAIALRDTGLRIAVVEPHPLNSPAQPSYDERTVALTWSTRQIYQGIGIWQDIASAGAEPIKDIHVSNLGHFGMSHLSCLDVGTEALGYVVPTRVIGNVLEQHMQQSDNINLIRPASAVSIASVNDESVVQLDQNEPPMEVNAKLTVLADGGRSRISKQFNSSASEYPQHALLCIVSTDRPHHGRAFERFTDEGPIALLPHSDQRYAVVWTCLPEQLAERMDLVDDEFILSLQQRFGDRAGNLSNPSVRKSYPLSRSTVLNPVADRVVIIGNAAHTVHPVAGQGFNLGMRDVAVLSELLFARSQTGVDLGSLDVLQEYARSRRRDTFMVSQFTHGLLQVFSSDLKTLGLLRNMALSGIELLPPVKRFLLKRTMGMAGRQPTLALGVPLSADHIRVLS